MSMFWWMRPPAYVAGIEGLEEEAKECYFTVSRRWEPILNEDEKSDWYWTNKHQNIKWWFGWMYTKVIDTKKWPKEKVYLELRDNSWEQKLIFSTRWNRNIRRFIWCFHKWERIWQLELVVYNRASTYTHKVTNKQIACINKWFSVYHMWEKLQQIEDEERDMIFNWLRRDKDDNGAVEKTHWTPLNEYFKTVLTTFKQQEHRTQTPEVPQSTQTIDDIVDDEDVADKEIATPITDRIRSKQEKNWNSDLPF